MAVVYAKKKKAVKAKPKYPNISACKIITKIFKKKKKITEKLWLLL